MTLTRFTPILFYISLKNIKKHLIFWYFQKGRIKRDHWKGLRKSSTSKFASHLWAFLYLQNIISWQYFLKKIIFIQKEPLQVFCKKGALKDIANFTVEHMCCRLKAFNFIKKRLQHRCFPGKFAIFFRTPILENICEWLLLFIQNSTFNRWLLSWWHPTKIWSNRNVLLVWTASVSPC